MDLLCEIKDVRNELHMISRILMHEEEVVTRIKLTADKPLITDEEWKSRHDHVKQIDEDVKRVEELVGLVLALMAQFTS
jgi:hypothetical protein